MNIYKRTSIKMSFLIKFIFFILLICNFQLIKAQDSPLKVIEFSGLLLNENKKHLPFAHVLVINKYRGTVTNFNGYFSFATHIGDTILFSSVGYKKQTLVIPDTITQDYLHVEIKLPIDTILLPEAVVLPWMTYEQFKQAFVNMEIEEDDYQRAVKNIALIVAEEKKNPGAMGPGGNYKYFNQLHNDKLYIRGQYPTIPILNPLVWAKLIEGFQNGDFKITPPNKDQ